MGGAPISASAAVYLLDRLRQREPDTTPDPDRRLEHLTAREIELLKVFARGQSYKEAARSLGISPLTVGNHVKAIYRKLRGQLARGGRLCGDPPGRSASLIWRTAVRSSHQPRSRSPDPSRPRHLKPVRETPSGCGPGVNMRLARPG